MIQNTDYTHLVDDVKAAVEHLDAARNAPDSETYKDAMFRCGLRLMRAEDGLRAMVYVMQDMELAQAKATPG